MILSPQLWNYSEVILVKQWCALWLSTNRHCHNEVGREKLIKSLTSPPKTSSSAWRQWRETHSVLCAHLNPEAAWGISLSRFYPPTLQPVTTTPWHKQNFYPECLRLRKAYLGWKTFSEIICAGKSEVFFNLKWYISTSPSSSFPLCPG